MAQITKIHVSPLGEFTISFSLKSERFEIAKYPDGLEGKITKRNFDLKSWNDVKKELDNIKSQYLHENLFVRKCIIIQLKTSESDYKILKEKFSLTRNGEKEIMTSSDYAERYTGFELRWFVAEEYLYPHNCIKYKIIESNKSEIIDNNHRSRIDIIHQLLYDSDGEIRLLDYREDLHEYLKTLEVKISEMLKQMIQYFDIDPKKFIENFETSKFKLLS